VKGFRYWIARLILKLWNPCRIKDCGNRAKSVFHFQERDIPICEHHQMIFAAMGALAPLYRTALEIEKKQAAEID